MTVRSEVVDEVTAAYRHYVEVFNGRDANQVADLYDRPHARMIGEIGLSIVNNDADQQAWYEFVMAYLDDEGWGRTEIDEVWIWPLSRRLAQLVANITRYKRDGSVMNHARANYTMRRGDDDAWKVVMTYPLLEDGFDVPVFPAG
jgi:ketosteroid isomerase-like protein